MSENLKAFLDAILNNKFDEAKLAFHADLHQRMKSRLNTGVSSEESTPDAEQQSVETEEKTD